MRTAYWATIHVQGLVYNSKGRYDARSIDKAIEDAADEALTRMPRTLEDADAESTRRDKYEEQERLMENRARRGF